MRQFHSLIRFFEFDAHLGLGITFSARSTIVDLEDGRGLVISPGPFDEAARSELSRGFQELLFVAPNTFHHLFLKSTQREFPQARIFAPPRVFKKQKALRQEMTPIRELSALIEGRVTMIAIEGNPVLDETVFWHNATQTLIVTDLLFHMREPMPRLRRWVLKMAGVYDCAGQSKLVRMGVRNEGLFEESIRQLVAHQPETIVVAHGEPIVGKSNCQKALLSILDRANKKK